MYSGRQALSEIDGSLQKIRSQLAQKDYDLQQFGRKLLALRQQESDTYRQLAKMRLDSMQANELTKQLDYAERQAAQLLLQRDDQINEVSSSIEDSENLQTQLDQERIEQAKQLDYAVEQLEDLLEAVDEQLSNDDAYNKQQLRAQDLVNMTSNARLKTEQAEDDLEAKGQPYRDDKLFMYLWSRHYGTNKYNAGFITRYFDKKVADHIRFDKMRINYFTLNNIPKKLAEHTDNLEQQAKDEMERLEAIERATEISAGAESKEKNVDIERNKLAEIDKKVTTEEESFKELLEKREAFNLGTDKYIGKAIDVLMDSFKAEPIPQLRHEARNTDTPRDDHLINQLSILRDSKSQLENDVSGFESQRLSIHHKLSQLKDVRRKFKRADYDACNSGFQGGDLFNSLLAQFINNQVSSKDLWRIFKNKQRFVRRRYKQRNGGIGLPGGINLPTSGNFPTGNNFPSIKIPRGIRFPSGWGGGGSGGGRSGGSGGGFRTGGGF